MPITPPALDPATVAPRTSSTYPEPFRSRVLPREKRGLEVKVTKFDFVKNAKAAILLKKKGFVKFITDPKYGEILGVHIVGPQATDLLAEPALAISAEMPIEELARTVHAHPTLYEAIGEAASMAAGRAAHG